MLATPHMTDFRPDLAVQKALLTSMRDNLRQQGYQAEITRWAMEAMPGDNAAAMAAEREKATAAYAGARRLQVELDGLVEAPDA